MLEDDVDELAALDLRKSLAHVVRRFRRGYGSLRSWLWSVSHETTCQANVYQELLDFETEVLGESPEAWALAERYLEHRILPESFTADGLHIALASVAEVDLLVSWNFKHIVRFDKIRQFNAVNREAGYKEIEIYSPREVTRYEQR